MKFDSPNMHYIFNIEYFNDIELMDTPKEEFQKFKERDTAIERFGFEKTPLSEGLAEISGYKELEMKTTYPGLMIGTGNPHEIRAENAIKCGFSFDYVTGCPYIPGSSLKGALRSCFPGKHGSEQKAEYEAYIREILKNDLKDKKAGKDYCLGATDAGRINLQALKESIFDGQDTFIGGFPKIENKRISLLQMDFITPHKSPLDNPNPINMLKVKPGCSFIFSFILRDSVIETDEGDMITVSAEQKLRLFRQLILDMGLGAKTNVGFGQFDSVDDCIPESRAEKKEKEVKKAEKKKKKKAPLCNEHQAPMNVNKKCRNSVEWNEAKGDWNKYCPSCMEKLKMFNISID